MKVLLEKIQNDIKFINDCYCKYDENTSTMFMIDDLKSKGILIKEIEDKIEDTVFEYTVSKFDNVSKNTLRGAWLNSFISWIEREIPGEKVFLVTSSLHHLHNRFSK